MENSARIRDVVLGAKRLLVTSHVPPDGDGLGSGIALVRFLRSRGVDSIFATGGPFQRSLEFVVRPDEIDTTPEGPEGPFDVVVSLDSGSIARLPDGGSHCAAAETVVVVDHHRTNENFGTINFVDPVSPATGEMMYRLFVDWKVEITAEMALPLYVALVTDTGRFGYPSTNPGAHRMAAALLETGMRPAEAHNRLFRSTPPEYVRLTGFAVSAMEMHAEGRVAVVAVTDEMIRDSGVDPMDVGDLVDVIMSMAGVEVGLLLRNRSEGDGTKVSLRSREWFPVDRLAMLWGGGGHARASGAVIGERLEEATRTVTAALLEEFARRTES